ncbi:amidophosphoribosyltransferase [Umezakia ovalisporum]|uniref:Amidophosphoribosyltransferase n=1 Tax=Umezakia ovalisporum FSS-43 TaxID=2740520 RepID=A0ABT6K1B3_9CYAN|nr:amidophosphoribosyltransferase [Umezakia ovalisporum]MBI1240877.1 amidophosphoribosyltransferase [Nostoc sp. RI_552]MDH6056149.1 amidophosphoribosyltransferase [Umezakia ovalisporum FSS-43]MDH6066568.1 amidophosphoribosyltransferase [Umezakia ovalisporum APH033B]MDH6070682.1 amidophosphoribosyltransferase [Umezakia ovalisporum CobakiLakeA]MDH6073953.1 amidophosphoribosyltransferase [Umezakia ovalisporum CS-1034]
MIPIHSVTMATPNKRSNEYPNQVTDSINSHEHLPDKPEEACGVFGIYAPEEDVAKMTYFGLYALQHRGQESAGIATFEDGKVHLHKDMGLVSQVFNERVLAHLPGSLAIGHTRYSTTGSSRKDNAQPAVIETRLGSLALSHNGNLVNTLPLREELAQTKVSLVTTTDSELIALAIAEAVNAGADWLEGATKAFHRCQGAFSLVIGTPAGVMGARDPNGIRPLVIGTLPGNPVRYVLASETCGLDIIGAQYLRDVEPGELVLITEEGLASYRWSPKPQRKLCIFEMIYFARPDSIMHNESLYTYRMRLGRQIAAESTVDADIVFGVPDSGIPAAIGFAQASGVPYAEGLIKNRYVGRTFIQPTQSMRESGIRMKLNPLKDVLIGKRVIIVDDSIVRGTTSRKLVKALREAGVIEVHMRISSPPVTHPCFYGIDTDTQDQLIAATKSVKEIAEQLGVDSLAYLSWKGMLEATKEDTNTFCSACFTGDYPVTIPEQVKRSKLMLEKVVV